MLSIVKLILAISFTFGVTRGQGPARYNHLCGFLNKQAARHHWKVCDEFQGSTKALRKKRGISTTVGGLPISTKAPLLQSTATTYRTLDSYVCNNIPLNRSNGYQSSGRGIVLKVNMFNDGDEWKANISWTRPKDRNQRKCIGYRITWYKPGEIFEPDYCDLIMNENITSYIIDSSKGWIDLQILDVAVFPLPERSDSRSVQFRRFEISFPTTPSFAFDSTQMDSTTSSPSNNKNNFVTKRSKGYLSGAVVATIIVGVGTVTIISFLVVCCTIRKGICKKKRSYFLRPLKPGTNGLYISYYSDNDTITETAIQVATWLSQKKINVIVDKFGVITCSKRRWSEQQISAAKQVILIISPGYLKICKCDKKINNEIKEFKDQLAYDEICHIRHEMEKPLMAAKTFIAILVNTEFNDLPHWLTNIKTYKYSNGKLDESILYVLKDGEGRNCCQLPCINQI